MFSCVCSHTATAVSAAACAKLHDFLIKVFLVKIHYLVLFYSRLKIVDDDIDWKQLVKEEQEVEEDEEEAPVVRT